MDHTINRSKLTSEINDLNSYIKYTLFGKVSQIRFSLMFEKEDLLLETYQCLTKKKEKIKTKIQTFNESGFLNTYIVNIVEKYFYNLSRNQSKNDIDFLNTKETEKENNLSNTEMAETIANDSRRYFFYYSYIKTPFDYYQQQNEFILLRNIVNRELTKSELKIFRTIYELSDNFKEINNAVPLSNSEVANKLNLTKVFVKKTKSIIFKKIKVTQQCNNGVDLLIYEVQLLFSTKVFQRL